MAHTSPTPSASFGSELSLSNAGSEAEANPPGNRAAPATAQMGKLPSSVSRSTMARQISPGEIWTVFFLFIIIIKWTTSNVPLYRHTRLRALGEQVALAL